MSDLNKRVSDLEERVDKLEDKLDDSGEKVSKPTSINEFKQKFDYSTYTDKAILVAYYLEKHKGVQNFTSEKVSEWFQRAKWKTPANMVDTISKAASSNGYFMEVDKEDQTKVWLLTETGEDYAENELRGESDG